MQKQKERYVGYKVVPMRDFWIDCYSTAIFSLLLSFTETNRNFIFNNNYIYVYDVNEKKKLGRVFIKTQIDDLVDKLLLEKEEHVFKNDEYFVNSMKAYLNAGKIVMLGIDMFYGVEDTSQWNRHHIRHYILVEGYDDATKEFSILETGEKGYLEYQIAYDKLERAAKGFEESSYIYSINTKYVGGLIDVDIVKNNAKHIIDSIDEVCSHMKEMWHVDEKYVLSMRDELHTHLYSMGNRQKVNSILFSKSFFKSLYPNHEDKFAKLEKEFNELLHFLCDICTHGRYYENEKKVKDWFVKILFSERDLWKEII